MTAYKDRLEAGAYLPAPAAEDTTVADLKDQLAAKGLPVSGNKDELIARLENADTDDDDA